MILRLFLYAIFMLLMFSNTASAQSLHNTTFMVESIIPYAYISNGTATGINVEILIEALAAVNIKRPASDVQIIPWARAYKTILSAPNTCTISTVRSPKRESLFKWAGPITGYECSFISKKKNKKINIINNLKRLKTAAIRDAISYDTLIKMGFNKKNVEAVVTIKMLVQKLQYGRVDIIFSNPHAIFNEMKNLNINTNNYEIIKTVNTGDMYCAFNNATDDSLVKKLQRGIDIIRANGKLDQIIDKYRQQLNK
ncbi:transporter substrate-binding domain-containing protein [Maridesulfovibrio sp.]|uniref:substrate-binding periplasmic protein n=1 Tax=Maridesulfovibrio sp. TaxID=2795000 RepID=UPI002A18DA67|nr:transporter substrate-binding domain-containing protein [Maridesulfovibrio sp.]